MYLLKPTKYLLLIALSVFISEGCKTVSTGEMSNTQLLEASKTDAPFPNLEPEIYQTEIVLTTEKGVEKYFFARKADKSRYDLGYGAANQVTNLTADNDYVIVPSGKAYAEYKIVHGFDERGGTLEDITHGMINGRDKAIYKMVSEEGAFITYQVWSDVSSSAETLIVFDKNSGVPVKKEVYKNDGGERKLEYSVHLVGFTNQVDDTLFTVPKEFRKVTAEEMKGILIGLP